MIRVVVVDDEALVRSGFELILRAADDIDVVATASGAQALDRVAEHAPDVVLLDLRMPDMDGLTILRELRRRPNPPVVAILTTFGVDEYVATALRSGAAGFLLKDTDPHQLPHMVRTLAKGGVVLSPAVARTVVEGFLAGEAHKSASSPVARLSERESMVLTLMADGLSNRIIGSKLHLSVGTVKDEVSTILGKLGVGNRVQAALVAQRGGLVK
ncbi:DNA-binding response regulator, NarL/FixJ family, contains REC and HTH domains [Actinokineospora alba]|uniref:DNA-binding response regulator, NarL/FixJ family, contains REC and HTH domains n=1 Tax=Actinokineospora alba TaxID=504798 RepID=A0A1H0LWW1_9PSEU|nr:response regulator transcription factor [Actinokineospora alba]TDP67484.1 LuxR family two component transcriptional regulator [Actinokineospora alba]SDI47186.1 DNA-binding response regulator, NarL/FixJ family, contains REC and HTH domains [Actinokineospora alba]SDO72476.1 DNA-binding response regulator, NarL/FixJ family, contains REC and HTH domains [Actinokineospora alba]